MQEILLLIAEMLRSCNPSPWQNDMTDIITILFPKFPQVTSSFTMAQPSVLDYARFYGIAVDHLMSDPVKCIPVDKAEDIDSSLRDPIDAPHLSLASLPSLAQFEKEKLGVGRDAAVFLCSAMKPPVILHDESEKLWDECLPDRYRVTNMMQEVPMVKSDHELDMRLFRSRISLETLELDLPLEIIDDENDEGLRFPSNFWEMSRQMRERLKREKLDCTREVLMFIQGIRDPGASLTEEWIQDLLERELCYTKVSLGAAGLATRWTDLNNRKRSWSH
jgi:hypothetical protein